MNIKRLAKIGRGTGRKKREINLLELAEEIKSLYNENKSLAKIARTIKLSSEMVRQFLKINSLEERTKDLIRKGLIQSVDACYRLSKIEGNEQTILAKQIIDKSLNSDDVRAIIKYKINNPKLPMLKLVEKLIRSKDRKIYVAYLGIEKNTFERFSSKIPNKMARAKEIRSMFYNVVPSKFISSFELNGRVVILKVHPAGANIIRNKAKELKVPLAKLAEALVNEYLLGSKL